MQNSQIVKCMLIPSKKSEEISKELHWNINQGLTQGTSDHTFLPTLYIWDSNLQKQKRGKAGEARAGGGTRISANPLDVIVSRCLLFN